MDIAGQKYVASTSSHGDINSWNARTHVYSLSTDLSLGF